MSEVAVLWLVSRNSLGKEFHIVSDRVQRMPEGQMSSDGSTSWWPVAERRWRSPRSDWYQEVHTPIYCTSWFNGDMSAVP